MAKLKNTILKQNLQAYRTLIVDTDPLSKFFKIAQFPEVLTAGKNAFLIAGTSNLTPGAEIKIEILDSNGNTIFLQPIKDYNEGLSRVISIEIYEDTPPGLATITILGQATTDLDGNPIPPEWQNVYNVKWSRTIAVDPLRPNTTPIRLYDIPNIFVSESLFPFRYTSLASTTIFTGSGGMYIVGQTAQRQAIPTNFNDNIYTLVANGFIFTRDMIGAQVTASFPSGIYTSSISQIINSGTAVMADSYISSGNYSQFTATNFTMSYQGTGSYIPTEYTRSFAAVQLSNLTTFSGDVRRVKFYAKSLDSQGQYEQISDVIVDSNELLVTQSNGREQFFQNLGYIYDNTWAQQYWVAGAITSSLYRNS